jgi:hypothetical protein
MTADPPRIVVVCRSWLGYYASQALFAVPLVWLILPTVSYEGIGETSFLYRNGRLTDDARSQAQRLYSSSRGLRGEGAVHRITKLFTDLPTSC